MTASKQSQDVPSCASGWLFKKKSITVHSNMNEKSQ